MITLFNRMKVFVLGFVLMGFIESVGAVVSIDSPQPNIYIPASNFTGAIPDTSDVITDGTGGSTDDSVSGDYDLNGILTPTSLAGGLALEIAVELTNGATFTADPAMGDLWDGNSSVVFSLIGVGAGASSVIFRGNTEDGLSMANIFGIDVRGVTVVNQDPVDVTVTIQWVDNFGETLVKTARVPYIRFAGNSPIDLEITTGPLVYAAENDTVTDNSIDDTVDVVTDRTGLAKDDLVSGVMDLTGELSAVVPEKVDLLFSYTLSSGATFKASPVMGDLWDGNSSQPFVMTTGGIGQSYATFSAASGDGFAATSKFTLDVRGIRVLSQDDVTLNIEIQTQSGTSVSTIKSLAIPYIQFSNAIEVAYSANDEVELIDVSQNSRFFDGGVADASTRAGNITITGNQWLSTQGSWKLDFSDLLESLSLSVEGAGGLDAFSQAGGSITLGGNAATIMGTVANVEELGPLAIDASVIVSVPSNNTLAIQQTPLQASTSGIAKSGYTNASVNTSGALAAIGYSDADGDGTANQSDNCASVSNPDQADQDGDGKGDDCDPDLDGDGVANADDNCPTVANSSQTPSSGSGDRGEACDTDSDLDGVYDQDDVFVEDATEWADSDSDGVGDNLDSDADVRARTYLMTTSTSQNFTRLHIINSSRTPQQFTGTLFNGDGRRLGDADTVLHSGVIAPQQRLVLTSVDLEGLFGTSAWSGPAMLEVAGTAAFDLMTKLTSPSGLISNTNCVTQAVVHNVEGFDSQNRTFVRLINIGSSDIPAIRGTLRDAAGDQIGASGVVLRSSLAAKQAVWLTREDLGDLFSGTWNGSATLEINDPNQNLRLLNLNFVNEETFFNFSCFESSDSGRVYLMTNSESQNISETHLINSTDSAVEFTGTLHAGDGSQLGESGVKLHDGTVAAGARSIVSATDLEQRFGVAAWSGPALLEVQSSGGFSLLTRLTSPSGLVSNTNCVRRHNVQNIEGTDSANVTYIRFINQGASTITNLTGTLYDSGGRILGSEQTQLLAQLDPKQAVWINRTSLGTLFETWEGEASLVLQSDAWPDLRLINLNFVNGETFFNFSCYESGS